MSLKRFFTEEIDKMVYIVMGVSGSGKTTVGQLLASQLDLPFYDADDFHSVDNISKMENGTPLTDEDRESWLTTLSGKIVGWEAEGGAVLACSALKEQYRKILGSQMQDATRWIFLKGPKELIKERMRKRGGHFMQASLLDSQFDILEEPQYGIWVEIDDQPHFIVKKILAAVPN